MAIRGCVAHFDGVHKCFGALIVTDFMVVIEDTVSFRMIIIAPILKIYIKHTEITRQDFFVTCYIRMDNNIEISCMTLIKTHTQILASGWGNQPN